MLLDDAAHASEVSYTFHNAIIMVFVEQAANHGYSTSSELWCAPRALDDTRQKGNLNIFAICGLCTCYHLDPFASIWSRVRLPEIASGYVFHIGPTPLQWLRKGTYP